jgi:hypothetical protein
MFNTISDKINTYETDVSIIHMQVSLMVNAISNLERKCYFVSNKLNAMQRSLTLLSFLLFTVSSRT